MANHASAKKRARQTIKRTDRNRAVRTTVRTFMKRLRAAISQGQLGEADKLLKVVTEQVDKAVSKGVFHRVTGSRYVSRLASQLFSARTASK